MILPGLPVFLKQHLFGHARSTCDMTTIFQMQTLRMDPCKTYNLFGCQPQLQGPPEKTKKEAHKFKAHAVIPAPR